MLGHTSKEEPMCKASIRFDDLWKHVSSGVTPYKSFSKLSDILHLNNRNNQLER